MGVLNGTGGEGRTVGQEGTGTALLPCPVHTAKFVPRGLIGNAVPDIPKPAFLRAMLAGVEAAVRRDDHAAAVRHAMIRAKSKAKPQKRRGAEARFLNQMLGVPDALPHSHVVFTRSHSVQRAKVHTYPVLVPHIFPEVGKKMGNPAPVILVHIAADGHADARRAHIADCVHHLVVVIVVGVIMLAVNVILLRAIHGYLDVGKVPIARHLLNDLRRNQAAIGNHVGCVIEPRFPQPFADAVNGPDPQQRLPSEPAQAHLVAFMGVEDVAYHLLHDLRRHGDRLHALLVAVNAPGVASEGGQDGVSPYALLFAVSPHEGGNLVVPGALVPVFGHKKLGRDQLVPALSRPGRRWQRAFDALLGQVVEHIPLPAVLEGQDVLGGDIVYIRTRTDGWEQLRQRRVGLAYFDHSGFLIPSWSGAAGKAWARCAETAAPLRRVSQSFLPVGWYYWSALRLNVNVTYA